MNWAPTTINGFNTYFSGCGTTGVEFNPESTKFTTIYPNPASDRVTIDFYLDKSSSVSIEVYSMDGKQIFSETVSSVNTGFNYTYINVSDYAHGIYVVKLMQDQNVVDQRMLTVIK